MTDEFFARLQDVYRDPTLHRSVLRELLLFVAGLHVTVTTDMTTSPELAELEGEDLDLARLAAMGYSAEVFYSTMRNALEVQ